MMKKKVSVIIPTFNRSFYLGEAISSVLNQDYKNFELIVINDGSTDKTIEVIEKYKKFLLYYEQKNQGVSAARNKGIELANGDYLFFLDDDDLLLPAALSQLVSFMGEQHFTVKAIYGYPQGNHFFSQKIDNSRNQLIFDFLIGNKFSGLGLLDREKTLEIGSFSEDFLYAEDYEFWTKFILRSSLAILQKNIFIYRKHKNNSSLINKHLVRLDVDRVCFKLLYSVNFNEEVEIFRNRKGLSLMTEQIMQNLVLRMIKKPFPALDTALEILRIAQELQFSPVREKMIIGLQNEIDKFLETNFGFSLRMTESEKNRLKNGNSRKRN